MKLETMIALASLAATIAGPFILAWGANKYFLGAFKEWKNSIDEWRAGVNEKLEDIASIKTKVERNEKDIETIMDISILEKRRRG